jgi:hypothetical protein
MEAAALMSADARKAMNRAARERVAAEFDAGRQYAALADLIEKGTPTRQRATSIVRPQRSLEPCK